MPKSLRALLAPLTLILTPTLSLALAVARYVTRNRSEDWGYDYRNTVLVEKVGHILAWFEREHAEAQAAP